MLNFNNQFITFVEQYAKDVENFEKEKRRVAVMERKVKEARMHIYNEIREALRAVDKDYKEGVNNIPLPDGRVLKITHKVTRKILPDQIEVARNHYARMAPDNEIVFDDLLRIKHELFVRTYKQLSPAGKLAASWMIEAREAAPTVALA